MFASCREEPFADAGCWGRRDATPTIGAKEALRETSDPCGGIGIGLLSAGGFENVLAPADFS